MGILNRYLVSILCIAALVALMATFVSDIGSTTVALLLLLVILVIATLFGSREALLASIVAVLCFNFFFLPPFHTFTIRDKENWVAFAALIITSLVAGQLSKYARMKGEESERRKLEIERLYDELHGAFEKASEAEAIKRSEELKTALLDAITHDLYTPLTSIKASATSLLESKRTAVLDKEGEVEFLEIIVDESDRLNEFIEGMVGIAQIEAGVPGRKKHCASVPEIINNALKRASRRLEYHRMIVEVERDLPNIFVNAGSVSEALYLILDNAAKYSRKGSEIKITAKQDVVFTRVSIENQGEGIPHEQRSRIFEKFVRLKDDNVPSTKEGMGLGLAIVKGIIESQGGDVRVEDGRDGFVTSFVIRLPLEEE